jgi:hypothetical protein
MEKEPEDRREWAGIVREAKLNLKGPYSQRRRKKRVL